MNETAAIIARIVVAYPNSDKFRDEGSVKATVALWATVFADDPNDLVTLAVTRHIATSKWPPAIAEIREIMTAITRPDIVPPHEAWLAVANARTALSEFSSDSEVRAALPAMVADVVLSMGWSGACRSREDFQSDFMRIYRAAYDAARAEAATPPALRRQMDAMRVGSVRLEHRKLALIAERAGDRRTLYESIYQTTDPTYYARALEGGSGQ